MKYYFLLLMLFPTLLSAQSKSRKQWYEQQKKFQYYLSTVEDFDKAESILTQMQKIANKKFKYSDSLYALTVTREAELYQAQKLYFQGNVKLMPYLEKIREENKKNKKLSAAHYNLFLVYGNNCYYIAESLMFGRKLNDNGLIVPELPEEKFRMSLKYFNSAIESFQELKTLYPQHPYVNENMAAVYRIRGRLQGQYLGDLPGCIATLEKSLEFGEDLETYRLLGVANGILGKHFIAIDFFERGLKIASGTDAASLLYGLEVAYRQLSDRETDPLRKEEFAHKADSFHIQWKAADPNFDPLGGK